MLTLINFLILLHISTAEKRQKHRNVMKDKKLSFHSCFSSADSYIHTSFFIWSCIFVFSSFILLKMS